MTRLDQLKLGDSPDHPVLAEPWSYQIVAVRTTFNSTSQQESALELDLVRDAITVRLRFEGIQELEIEKGFPYSCMGLEILDISDLKWDGLKVRVTGFEPAPGIHFWARSVERIV